MNQYDDSISEKYLCPICQCLLVNPLTLSTCQHTFCSKCLDSVIENEKNLVCALCRKEFAKKQVKQNSELASEINSKKVKCKCGNILPMNQYDEHTIACNSFKQELAKNIQKAVVKNNIK